MVMNPAKKQSLAEALATQWLGRPELAYEKLSDLVQDIEDAMADIGLDPDRTLKLTETESTLIWRNLLANANRPIQSLPSAPPAAKASPVAGASPANSELSANSATEALDRNSANAQEDVKVAAASLQEAEKAVLTASYFEGQTLADRVLAMKAVGFQSREIEGALEFADYLIQSSQRRVEFEATNFDPRTIATELGGKLPNDLQQKAAALSADAIQKLANLAASANRQTGTVPTSESESTT